MGIAVGDGGRAELPEHDLHRPVGAKVADLHGKAALRHAQGVPLQLRRLRGAARALEVLLDLPGGQPLLGAAEIDGKAQVDGEVNVTSSANAHTAQYSFRARPATSAGSLREAR